MSVTLDQRAAIHLQAQVLERLKPLLARIPAPIQAAVLGEAVAILLAGHPDFMREQILTDLTNLARDLVPEVEREIFNGGQHPQNQGGGSTP